MKLSLVIATYNRGPAIERLLSSLHLQSFDKSEWEVVVVDDGSSDDTHQRLQRFSDSKVCHFRFLTQNNAGQASARDRGIRAAVGQRIVVTDDDMELAPNFLAAHWNAAAADPGMTVVLGSIRPTDGWLRKPLFDVVGEYRLAMTHQKFATGQWQPGAIDLVTGNISYPRSLYLAVGGFDLQLRLWEDLELGARLVRAGAKIVFASEAWTIHHCDIGNYQRWKARQINYAHASLHVWRANGCQAEQHPLRNLMLGNRWKRLAVLGVCWSDWTAEAAVEFLARCGDRLQALGMIRGGIAAYQLIESLGFQLGLKKSLGSWRQVRELMRLFWLGGGEEI